MKLGELAEIARALSVEQFEELYPHPALVFLRAAGESQMMPLLGDESDSAREDVLGQTHAGDAANKIFEIDVHSLVVFLKRSRTSIGRKAGNDICIVRNSLSRTHATIEAGVDSWSVVDAGSSAGTSVNGRVVMPKRSQPLQDGARIELGPEVVAKFYLPRGLHEFIAFFASSAPQSEDMRYKPY